MLNTTGTDCAGQGSCFTAQPNTCNDTRLHDMHTVTGDCDKDKTEFTLEDNWKDIAGEINFFSFAKGNKRYKHIPYMGLDYSAYDINHGFGNSPSDPSSGMNRATLLKMFALKETNFFSYKPNGYQPGESGDRYGAQDCEGVYYGETFSQKFHSIIATDATVDAAANTTTFVTDDVSKFYPDRLLFVWVTDPDDPCCRVEFRVRVKEVNPNTNEVTVYGQYANFVAGSRVVAGFPLIGKCMSPENNSYENKYQLKKSYRQYVAGRFSIEECDWNKSAKTRLKAKRIMKQKMETSMIDGMHSIAMARLTGVNLLADYSKKITGQAPGLAPVVQAGKECGACNDFVIGAAGATVSPSQAAQTLKAIANHAFENSSENRGDEDILIIECTTGFIKEAQRVIKAMHHMAMGGLKIISEMPSMPEFTFRTGFKTEYGTVLLYVNQTMDEWLGRNEKVGYYYPLHQHLLVTPEIFELEDKSGNIVNIPGKIDFKRVKAKYDDSIGECPQEFIRWFKFTFIWSGICTGSIGRITFLTSFDTQANLEAFCLANAVSPEEEIIPEELEEDETGGDTDDPNLTPDDNDDVPDADNPEENPNA